MSPDERWGQDQKPAPLEEDSRIRSITPSESESTVDKIREYGCYRDNELSCKTCSARETNKVEKMKVQESKIGSVENELREASSSSSTGGLQPLCPVCSNVHEGSEEWWHESRCNRKAVGLFQVRLLLNRHLTPVYFITLRSVWGN